MIYLVEMLNFDSYIKKPDGNPPTPAFAKAGAAPGTTLSFLATGIPRPHPWLLMGVQLFLGGPACRSPGIRSQQASQGHINGFLWASKLAVCQPLNP